AGRLLVRTLGRQLHLRHLAGALRSADRRRGHEPGVDPEGGPVTRERPVRGRLLRRVRRQLRRSVTEGDGTLDRVADRLGDDGSAGRPRRGARGRGGRYTLARQDADRVGELGRALVYRHGLPARLLPPLPPLPALLPGHVPGALAAGASVALELPFIQLQSRSLERSLSHSLVGS